MSYRTKVVDGPEVIEADFVRLGLKYPMLAMKAFEVTIDQKIGPETQEECPVETGYLQGSWSESEGTAFVKERKMEKGRVSRTFGYGANYAFWVHEIPPPEKGPAEGGTRTARHAPPTKYKFLEDPAMRHRDDPPKLLLRYVEQLLADGGE